MKTPNLTTERLNLLLSALMDVEAWQSSTSSGRHTLKHKSGVRLYSPDQRSFYVDGVPLLLSKSESDRLLASLNAVVHDIKEACNKRQIKRNAETLAKAFKKLACRTRE